VGEHIQTLGGQVLGQQHEVGADAGVLGKARVRVCDEALDGLGREVPAVAQGQASNAGRKAFVGQDRG